MRLGGKKCTKTCDLGINICVSERLGGVLGRLGVSCGVLKVSWRRLGSILRCHQQNFEASLAAVRVGAYNAFVVLQLTRNSCVVGFVAEWTFRPASETF